MGIDRKPAGQILDVPPANREIVNAGDSELAAARLVLLAAWIRDARRIRSHLRVFYDSLLSFLEIDSRYDVEDTALLSAQSDRAIEKIRRELGPTMQAIDNDVRASVRRSVWRASKAQEKHLARLGVPLPTQAEIEIIRQEALLGLERDFPRGSGITYSDRLLRIEDQHADQLARMTSAKYSEGAKDRIIRETKDGVLFSRNARTPVGGGSLSKKAMRLLVAEETRLANEVELGLLRTSKIEFAHWRLCPTHKWYGGSEVCEVLASHEDPTIADQLARTPGGGAGVGLSGLFRVDEWPMYPHPFCKCFPEAVVL